MTKQSKIIVGIVIGILVLGALLFYAQPQYNQQANSSDRNGLKGPISVVETNNYDFGTISMKEGKVSTIFKIKNTGSQPVKMSKLYTSCMCTETTLKVEGKTKGPFGMLGHGFIPSFDEMLQPEGVAEIEIVFDPAAHGPTSVGKIQRTVTLENSGGQPIELFIAANVTP